MPDAPGTRGTVQNESVWPRGAEAKYSLSDAAIPTAEDIRSKPPMTVVDISNAQTSGTFRERRAQIRENAKEVIKKPYLNRDTDTLIFLTEKSYTHAFNNLGDLQLNAAEYIPELIENAVLTSTEKPTHGSDYASGVYTFFAAVRNGDSIIPVKLKVKEYTYSGQDLPKNIQEYFGRNPQDYAASYDTVVLEVEEIEESPHGSAKDMNQSGSFLNPHGLSDISVADLLGLVKGDAKKYVPGMQGANTNTINGGTDNAAAEEFTAPAGSGTGASVSDGGSQWDAGQRAAEQGGGMEKGAEGTRTRAADTARAAIDRQNRAKDLSLERVSPQELGIPDGASTKSLRVLPQDSWDDALKEAAESAYAQTGITPTFVIGPIKTKMGNVRGVLMGDRMIVQADHMRISPQQIVDHESYHFKENLSPSLHGQVRERIVQRFSESEFRKVLTRYMESLRGFADGSELTGDSAVQELESYAESEAFADAYAGINAFGANTARYTEDVNGYLEEVGAGKPGLQENGVRQTNAPPAGLQTSYSADGDGKANAEDQQKEEYGPLRMGALENEGLGDNPYKNRSMTEDASIYSYDFLTALPDAQVVVLPEVTDIRDAAGKIDARLAVDAGIKNARAVGTERDGKVFVRNAYTGKLLRIDSESIRHGVNGGLNRLLTNARLGAVIGDVVQNAVPVNALNNKAAGVSGTYAMAAYAADTNGREFVAIVTVEQRNGNISGLEVYDVTHAVSGRQKNGRQASTKLQGVYPIKTSTISIADILEAVKHTHQSILSEDVLAALGEVRNPQGDYVDKVRYSVDDNGDSSEISPKERQEAEQELAWVNRELERISDMAHQTKVLETSGIKGLQENEKLIRKLQNRRNRLKAKAAGEKYGKQPKKERPKAKPIAPSEAIIARKDLRQTMTSLFSIPDGEKAELGAMIDRTADCLMKNGAITEEDRKLFFDRLYASGVVNVPAEEIYRDARSYMRGGRIYVDEHIRADFGDDWNDIRRQGWVIWQAFYFQPFGTTTRRTKASRVMPNG